MIYYLLLHLNCKSYQLQTFLLNFTIRIIISPLLPTILHDMSLTGDQAGSLFLMSALGYFITLICSGFVSEKLLHKKTIGLSAVMTGIFFIITSFCNSLAMMRIGIFITGMAAGLYLPSGIAMLTASISKQNWGKAIGVHELAPNFSFLIAPIVCEAMLLWISWRSVLMVTGLMSMILGIIFLKFSKVKDFPGQSPKFNVLLQLLSSRSFWIMILLFTAGVTGTMGIYAMLPLYLVNEHGMLQTQANTLITLSRIMTLPMPFAVGWVSDRYGMKKTLTGVLILTGIFTLSLGLLSGSGLQVAVFFQPLLSVCFFPPAFSALSNIGVKETRNVMVSLTIPAAFLMGGGAAPTLIGFLADNGFFAMGVVGAGIAISAAALLPFFLKIEK
ncbi:MAG: MFS transporter [Desulfobacula sp.]|nr:MFS transporter [Desulfobacula sp.]